MGTTDREFLGRFDTTIGGAANQFPVTSWSLIAGVKDSDTSARRQALESLCHRYWKAVYHFIRRAWSKSNDDAKDLTQGFFLWLVEKDPLGKYLPERGGFRQYLKSLLRHFSSDRHDYETALKRGGGVKPLALDWESASLEPFLIDEETPDPEQVLDLAWKKDLLDRAIDRARHWFVSSGREVQFRAFEAYDLAEGPEKISYADVAAKLGVKESDVRNYLFEVRDRIRSEARTELSQTVSDMRGLEEEWNALFGP